MEKAKDELSNVIKMEESLKKLKKVQEKSLSVAGKDESAGLSDDDKIRKAAALLGCDVRIEGDVPTRGWWRGRMVLRSSKWWNLL